MKTRPLSLLVLKRYGVVTDGRTDGQTDRCTERQNYHSKYALFSRVMIEFGS